MASLYFYYGAMGSSKTANALMARYNYMEKGQKVLLLRPAIDTRFGKGIVKIFLLWSNGLIENRKCIDGKI